MTVLQAWEIYKMFWNTRYTVDTAVDTISRDIYTQHRLVSASGHNCVYGLYGVFSWSWSSHTHQHSYATLCSNTELDWWLVQHRRESCHDPSAAGPAPPPRPAPALALARCGGRHGNTSAANTWRNVRTFSHQSAVFNELWSQGKLRSLQQPTMGDDLGVAWRMVVVVVTLQVWGLHSCVTSHHAANSWAPTPLNTPTTR